MPTAETLTTTVSTMGQIILPKAIRQALGWDEGTGTLTFSWEDKAQVGSGSLVDGKSDGLWILHHADGRVEEVAYADGKMSDR